MTSRGQRTEQSCPEDGRITTLPRSMFVELERKQLDWELQNHHDKQAGEIEAPDVRVNRAMTCHARYHYRDSSHGWQHIEDVHDATGERYWIHD